MAEEVKERQEPEIKQKPPASLLRNLIFLFLFLAVAGLVGVTLLPAEYQRKLGLAGTAEIETPPPVEEIAVKEAPVADNNENPADESDPEPLAKEELPPEPPKIPPQFMPDVKRLETLEQHNRLLTIYIAASELQQKISDPEKFRFGMVFLSSAAQGETDLEGKIDLLRQSAEGDFPTINSLKKELREIHRKIDSRKEITFWGSVKSAVDGLVEVTKTSGDVDGSDYQAVIRRAEIALEKNDINTAIAEVTKLEADGEEWVMKAKNLSRVIEVTGQILDYARTRLVEIAAPAKPEITQVKVPKVYNRAFVTGTTGGSF